MANLDEIQIKISQDSSGASKAIDSLISSLENLSKATDLGTSANNIKELSSSIKTLSSASKKFDMGNVAEQLKAIPDAIKGLGELPVEQIQSFTNTVRILSDALEPLATQANSINLMTFSLSSFSPVSKQAANAGKNLEEENNRLADSFLRVGSAVGKGLKKLAGWGIGLGTIGKYIKDSVGLASNYLQTVKMLNVTMGDGAEEAKKFAEELGDVLGLNPADTMNFQATFQNLFVGFGNESKQAQIMSKNLTQLSYDMASFYGELVGNDPQAAAEKLRLGVAGTIEPIQRLGYAIKEADLQAVAARQGLNVNIRNLNTASKSMLRYIAIMEQSAHVQGDMARSFSTPAVALMVYKSSIKQLSTEVGETFLPMLMATIPYIQTFIRGLLDMVKTINGILGIELPKIGSDEQREGIASLGDEATETGKKMQKAFTLGIDELNVLDSSTADAGAGMQDITGLLELPEYDMLEGFSGNKLKEIEESLKPLEPLFDGLATAFAGFYQAISGFVDTTLYPWLVSIGKWMKENPETMELIGKGLGYVAIGLLAIKGVGALGKLLMIPQLITGLKNVHTWLGNMNISMWTVIGIGLMVAGAFMTIKGIMDIIRGEGDFLDNVKLALAGVAFMLSGYIIKTIIPSAIANFGKLATGGATSMAKLGAAGSVAMWSIVAAGALAIAYMLLNWDEASYQVQQTVAKLGFWVNEKVAWLGKKGAEFVANIRTLLTSLKFAVTKGVANLFGWILQSAGKLVDNIVEKIGVGLGLIDKLFGTDLQAKLEENYVSLEKSAENFKNSILSGLDAAETAAKDEIQADLQVDIEGWNDYVDNARALWDEYAASSQRIYDRAMAEKEAEEEAKRKAEQEESQKQTEEMLKQMEESMANIQMPEIQMPEMTKTLDESNQLQTTANELATASNTMQTEFNASTLEDNEQLQNLVGIGNLNEKASLNDIASLLKTVGSNIVSALREVEDACRNIKIEVHKHYGGEGYASGGFPTSGEMFFAREDGLPEMVGRVGRQTAVMNNGQIADTMAQSLIRAMGQSGATSQPQVIENKLYLDGEVVYANQQKIQRSKGYNLGMGVFANA